MKTTKNIFLIVSMFLTFQTYSQWLELSLPSVSPENKFVVSGSNYFTYQSPGGVFKSIDEGHSWSRALIGLPSTIEFRDLITFNDTLFISTFDEGVYMSRDFGDSWEKLSKLPEDAYNDFVIHNDRLFTVNRNGLIFKTEGTATNWTQVNHPEAWNNNSGGNRWVFSNGQDLLFVIGEGLLHKSGDNGDSWMQVDFGRTLYPLSLVYDIAISDSDIWIATVDQDYVPILLHSLDYGENWTVLEIESTYHVQSVAISDSFVAYMLSGSIYYSADNGQSWTNTYVTSDGKIVHNNSGEFLVSSVNGAKIFDASNGSITDFDSEGISDYDFPKIEIANNEIIVFSGGLPPYNLFTIDKASETILEIPKPVDVFNLQNIALLEGILYAEFNNSVYRYNFENQSWNATFVDFNNIYNLAAGQTRLYARSTDGFYFSQGDSDFFTKMDITSDGSIHSVFENDTLTVINSTDEILISKGEAITWESQDPDGFLAYYYSTAVTKSKFFTCTINGLFVSEDNGNTWKKIKSELIDHPRALLYKDNRLYVSTNEGILVSPDEGLHWFKKSEQNSYFFPTKNLLADETHLYANTIGGGIWKIAIEHLYNPPVIEGIIDGSLKFELGEDIILDIEDFIVTDNDNTFPNDFELIILSGEKYEIDDDGIISPTDLNIRDLIVSVQVTDGTTLSNIFEVPILIFEPLGISENKNLIYPNPSNSAFYLQMKSNGSYRIYVYDITGRLVQRTTQHTINSSITLDVSNLLIGEYIISITQGESVIKQRIIKN